MVEYMPFLIPIVTIICVFGFKAYKLHVMSRGVGLSSQDRAVLESLQASASRLEARIATLERAVLDNDQAFSVPQPERRFP